MRYRLVTQDGSYLMACYGPTGNGIVFTRMASDACSFITLEKAAETARLVGEGLGFIPNIEFAAS
jgi:hypothetical protein